MKSDSMRVTVLIAVLAGMIVLGSGCQEGDRRVTAEGFPADLAGVWKADKGNWELEITGEGTLERFVNDAGANILVAAGGAELQMSKDMKAVFVIGDTSVDYNAEERTMRVEIVTEQFAIELPKNQTIFGNRRDIFTGKVSEDGQTWPTIWRHPGHIDGAPPEDSDRPGEPLQFRKVSGTTE